MENAKNTRAAGEAVGRIGRFLDTMPSLPAKALRLNVKRNSIGGQPRLNKTAAGRKAV